MDRLELRSTLPWWREPTAEQWGCFLAAWLGWVLDAFDFTIFLLVMPAIGREFHVTLVMTSLLITLTLLLRLVGGLLAGAAADAWGRRLPLMVSIVWFAACDGAVALAPSFTWVLVLRTLFGLGMGAEWTSGAALAMENWPERTRGWASGVLQGSWAVGYITAAAILPWVLPRWGWRGLFAAAAAPALLVLPIRLWVKEPARRDTSGEGPRASLLQPSHRGAVVWATLVLALGFAGYQSLTSLYPTLLQTELHRPATSVASLVIVFNLGMLGGAVLWGVQATRRGAIQAILIPALGMALAFPLYVGWVPSGLAWGAFLGGALGAGHSGVTPLLLAQLFPESVRARAMGFIYHAGAALAALVPPFIAALSARTHSPLSRSIVGVGSLAELALVAVLLLRPRSILRSEAASAK